jgi:hypothetical protein
MNLLFWRGPDPVFPVDTGSLARDVIIHVGGLRLVVAAAAAAAVAVVTMMTPGQWCHLLRARHLLDERHQLGGLLLLLLLLGTHLFEEDSPLTFGAPRIFCLLLAQRFSHCRLLDSESFCGRALFGLERGKHCSTFRCRGVVSKDSFCTRTRRSRPLLFEQLHPLLL